MAELKAESQPKPSQWLDEVYWKPISFWSGDLLTSLMMTAYATENNSQFSSIGHFCQASKAVLFGDDIARRHIMDAKDPHEQKHLGFSIRNFDESRWLRYKSLILDSAIKSILRRTHPSWKEKWGTDVEAELTTTTTPGFCHYPTARPYILAGFPCAL
jgi:hypothetical protein